MKRIHTSILLAATIVALVTPSAPAFDGLDTGIGNLYRLSNAKSRSISPENFTVEKGKGGMPQVIPDDFIYVPGQRFGLYR